MKDFLTSRWFLLLTIVVFVICKIPHLHYAYYWDECTPYAVAIKAMYQHGISLMPTAIDPDLSRGHPLFFHACAAAWMNIFGPSHVAMHSFALFISALMLIAVYEAGIRLFNQRVAVMSLLLVASQVIFFVQASFVLLEVLTALLSFLCLYFYAKERLWATTLFLTILFFTKESGLMMGFVLGMDAFIGLFNKNNTLKLRLLRLASVAVPCFLVAVFFIAQKHTRGWYIYPLHHDLIDYKWGSFWYKFRIGGLVTVFLRDYRYLYFILVLALSVLAAIKNRNARYLVIFLPATCIYYFVDDMRAGRIMPAVPFFLLFVLSLLLILVVFKKLKIYSDMSQEKFIVLSVAFILCFLCFSSINFFTPRYLLAAIFPLLFFCAALVDKLCERSYNFLFYPALLLIVLIGIYSFKTNDSHSDCDLGAFDGIDVHQHVVDWCEQNNYYNRAITCGEYLEYEHLRDPETGFLHTGKAFNNVTRQIDHNTDFVVFDNIEGDNSYNDLKKNLSFHLVYRYQKGKVWAEVYGRY